MFKKLIMVTQKNNNKFYNMKSNDDNSFTVTYGRIGEKEVLKTYPMRDWNKKYNEKIKKGYKDVTEISQEMPDVSFKDVSDKDIMKLLNALQNYSKQSIKNNYNVTSKQVTQIQIDTAQEILNKISSIINNSYNVNNINDKLTELYSTIPRKMGKVQNFLLNPLDSIQKAKAILEREQDSIDTLKGQVSLNVDNKQDITLEEALGITVSKVKDDAVILQIKDLMKDEKDKFINAYEIIHKDSRDKFEQQKTKSVKHWTKLLWHGSRNENWLNILKTGLMIRPSCAVITGAMFGYGLYFADKCRKSVGYTSLSGSYWARGKSNQAFIAIYEVNTGKEFRIDTHKSEYSSYDFNKLKANGDYDSLFAKGGIDLRNNEYIIYKAEQCTIKYLIEIKG